MDSRILLTTVELVSDDELAVPVGEEVYGSRGDDADQRWPQTPEQRRRAFELVKIPIR